MAKKILMTGGGTAGHVTPNLALIPYLKEAGWEIEYMGSENGIERTLMEKEGIPYHGIATGKLRRYVSKENMKDMFRVVKGVSEAQRKIRKIKPDLVFSKGGFVAVPVVLGAKANGVPVIIHESDLTPGLANKIAMPAAKVVCTTFPETLEYVPKKKGIHVGSPIRKELFEGDRETGLAICGFSGEKPVLLMMGGSLGAVKLNTCMRNILPKLLETFDIIHLCGKGHMAEELQGVVGYKQFAYVSDELADLFGATDLIVSRAGSNSIFEFLALEKPHLLIPLSKRASRGDQILNANSFAKHGFAKVLDEDNMNEETFLRDVMDLYENRGMYVANMQKSHFANGTEKILQEIHKF